MNLDERNATLNQKIDDTELPDAVSTLVKDAKKRKRQVKLLTASIILDLLLTIGLGFLSIQTHNIASKSESTQQALIKGCESTNDARSSNKLLWHYLLDLPTPAAPTLQQQQVRDQFTQFVDKTFALRDCSAVIQ